MPNSTDLTDPIPVTPLRAGDDYSKYSVNRKTDIVHILRSIMKKGDLISASFGQGKHFMLTVIVGIDPDLNEVFLDFGSNDELNKIICESEKVIFVTVHDRVKVQFTVKRIEKTLFGGRNSFKIKLPESLVRLQRRENFRVPVPIINPLTCMLPLNDDDNLEVTILDISVGGACHILPSVDVELLPGTIFHKCQLELTDIGRITADMEVMNVFEVTMRNGVTSKRAGCRFIGLTTKMQSMLQRYITRIDRARLAILHDNK